MITFDVLPNDALKKELAKKMSAFMLRTSQVPIVYKDDLEKFKVVERADTDNLIQEAVNRLREFFMPHKKDYLHYFKNHLKKNEAFLVGLTLYFYDNEKEEYASRQTILPLKIDKHFFNALKKAHKNTKFKKQFSYYLHDVIYQMVLVSLSSRLDAISTEEWKAEYEV